MDISDGSRYQGARWGCALTRGLGLSSMFTVVGKSQFLVVGWLKSWLSSWLSGGAPAGPGSHPCPLPHGPLHLPASWSPAGASLTSLTGSPITPGPPRAASLLLYWHLRRPSFHVRHCNRGWSCLMSTAQLMLKGRAGPPALGTCGRFQNSAPHNLADC